MFRKKVFALILCALTAASAVTACGKNIEIDDPGSSVSEMSEPENVDIMNYTAPEKGDTIIEMNIRDYGTVKIRLFPEYADKGVENFVELAKDGFYDGLTFHRVIRDFMIQGGDPLGTGMGGKSIWGSSFDGGTDPHLIHLTGAVAYANSGTTASNGSQFYIVTGSEVDDSTFAYYAQRGITFSDNQKEMYKQYGGAPWLDGGYTVFGQVIDGLDVVFRIQYTGTDASGKPILENIVMDSVKVTEYNGEEIKWFLSDYDYDDPTQKEIVNFTAPEKGETIVNMKIKDYGSVKIKLFPEYAPKGVENFVEHVKDGYYDGLTFHRIISDFMIQGGDPLGNGTGGESIWGEKFDGGTYYNLIHAAGAIAYANSGSTDTNGSQFYIVTGQVYDDNSMADLKNSGYFITPSGEKTYKTVGGTPFLDGSYTVFGQVFDGLDIIFKIQNVKTDSSDKPIEDVIIESVTIEEYDGSALRWYMTDYSEDASEASEEETTSAEEESSAEEETTASEEETSAE